MTHPQLPIWGYEQLELTPLAQGAYEAQKPPVVRQPDTVSIARHIAESVMGESPYHSFPTTLEDGVWDAVHELEGQNGLPDGVTAHDVYQAYLRVFHHG